MSISTDLRIILDSYFETKEISGFEDLKSKCTNILKNHCDFLFVFREQRYFEIETTKDDLYFQYFSFGYSSPSGGLQFTKRDLLVEQIVNWSKNSEKHTSKYCQLYIRDCAVPIEEQVKVFNLLKRIVVFYYLNSGAKAHFLASVSQRMIKSFWRSDVGKREYTREEAINFLYENLEIDAALYAVVDELPVADSPVSECLTFVNSSSSYNVGSIHEALSNTTEVSENAKKSIGRRNRTIGTYQDITYGMSTISGNHVYVDDNDEVKNHSIIPEYLIVFSGEFIGLSVDKIEIASVFLNSVIKTIIDFEEVHFRRNVEGMCRELERALGENPLATRQQFEKRYLSLISRLFGSDFAMVGLFPMCLRLYRPSSNSLEKIFSTINHDEDELVLTNVDISDRKASCAHAFRSDAIISLWSQTKLDHRRELITKGVKNTSDEVLSQERMVGKLTNLVDEVGHAVVAVPVRINDLIVGTLEFSSPNRSDLQSFAEECEEFASQCGEFYRRLELANDRGWLVRMHFLHAARHRLQHIITRISDHSKELSEELSGLIAASVVNETDNAIDDDYFTSTECIALLEKKMQEAFSKHSGSKGIDVRNKFSEISKLDHVSRQNCILLSEVVDALAANVRKHGFRSDGFRVFAGAKCGDVETIVLSYRPEHTYEDKKRAQRVCVSPMPSSSGLENGYSYGLFLLATQIRMSGGWMISHADMPDQFDQTRFGFTVVLNASVWADLTKDYKGRNDNE